MEIQINFPARCGSSQRAALEMIAREGWIDIRQIATSVYSLTENKNYAYRAIRDAARNLGGFFRVASIENGWLINDPEVGWCVDGHPAAEQERSRRRGAEAKRFAWGTLHRYGCDPNRELTGKVVDAALLLARECAEIIGSGRFGNDVTTMRRTIFRVARASNQIAEAIASHATEGTLIRVLREKESFSYALVTSIAARFPHEAASILQSKPRGALQKMAVERLRGALAGAPEVAVKIDAILEGRRYESAAE